MLNKKNDTNTPPLSPPYKGEEREKNTTPCKGGEREKDNLEILEKKNKEYLDGWQRAKADYLNLKKESEKRYQDLIKFANASLILEILPVMDNFKLAVSHIPKDQLKADWVIGIAHIKKQLADILKNLGIEEIKTVGEKFNPELHEAVSAETREKRETEHEKHESGGSKGVIIKEVRSGYSMHGKVIQVAKVVVS